MIQHCFAGSFIAPSLSVDRTIGHRRVVVSGMHINRSDTGQSVRVRAGLVLLRDATHGSDDHGYIFPR